jgi:hypothetical protein
MPNNDVHNASVAVRCAGSCKMTPQKAYDNHGPTLGDKSSSNEGAHVIPPQPAAISLHPARSTRNTIEACENEKHSMTQSTLFAEPPGLTSWLRAPCLQVPRVAAMPLPVARHAAATSGKKKTQAHLHHSLPLPLLLALRGAGRTAASRL